MVQLQIISKILSTGKNDIVEEYKSNYLNTLNWLSPKTNFYKIELKK